MVGHPGTTAWPIGDMRRVFNILATRGWSFRLGELQVSRSVIRQSDTVMISGVVVNESSRLGTVYMVVLIANPYRHNEPLFNSDRDLNAGERQRLRIVDIPGGQSVRFSTQWTVPNDTEPGVYDIRIQLWNPPKLFRARRWFVRYHHHRYHQSEWKGIIEVMAIQRASEAEGEAREPNVMRSPKVFISYSWDSLEHRTWVLQLADELIRHGMQVIIDKYSLLLGEEITKFIERGIRESDVFLMICSTNYTERANQRIGGVGLETVIGSNTFLQARESKKYIPVVRNNLNPSASKLPTYVGSTLYIDMDTESWRSEPLQLLLRGIRETRLL